MIRKLVVLCLFAAQLAGQTSLDRKFSRIESDRLKPGTRIVMTSAEWNTWVAGEVPPGVTRTSIRLGTDRVTASASVDFLKLDRAAGNAPNWFLASILQGERPVTVSVRIQSSAGRARVDVERVEVAGVAVEGRALDFLIREYVIPNYPDAKVSRWFPLRHHMDRFEIQPAAVTVVLK